MTESKPIREDGRRRQKGALMAGLLAMIAVSLIWSAVAFQAWTDVLRRDNEAEMIFRAQDIVRAIQRYRKDHGGLGPRKLSDLLEPSPKRSYYIRREYDDPLVPDGKWGLLLMGPGGQILDPNVAPVAGVVVPGLDALNGENGANATGRTLAGEPSNNAGRLGGVGNPNQPGEEAAGLPIAGVKSLSTEKAFRVYRGENEYAKWLFTYQDLTGGLPGQGQEQGQGQGQGRSNDGRRRRPGQRDRNNRR